MKKFNIVMAGFLALVVFLLSPAIMFAHRSPDTCSGSGLSINLYATPSQAHVGDTISYTVDVSNGMDTGPVVCDVTDIQASITTPDGAVHDISLSRTSLSNGDSDTYSDVVSYVARTEDITGNALKATA